MHRTSHVTRVAVVLAALVTAIGLGGSGTANPPPASARTGVPSGRCPHHALRLPGIGAAHAAEKALHRAASDYPGTDTHGASIQAADRSAFAGARGREVRQQCGAAVARRTVVVQLFFPRMLPRSCSTRTPWPPIATGASFLEGYSALRGGTLDHPTIVEVAERLGRTPAQVIIRWHLQHGIVVIPKSVHPERIRANADVDGFQLSAADMSALDGLGRG